MLNHSVVPRQVRASALCLHSELVVEEWVKKVKRFVLSQDKMLIAQPLNPIQVEFLKKQTTKLRSGIRELKMNKISGGCRFIKEAGFKPEYAKTVLDKLEAE